MIVSVSRMSLVVALLSASPALAQTVPDDAQAQSASSPADGDIVVTARKREERAIDVPIAVSAVSGEQLEARGARNLADFLQEAPGVGIYDQGNGQSKITIRGISTSLGGNENGYYLDDLPFTGVTVPISPDVRAWDLDRVEVLRGPKGTLFGEGSIGGTVRILTKGADLNNWEAKGDAFVSGTDGGGSNGGLKGAFNAPIVPGVLGLRVAGTRERFNGWIDDPASGRKDVNHEAYDTFRAKARFDPTDRLSITGTYWKFNSSFPTGGALATDAGTLSRSVVVATGNRYELYGGSARYDLGGAEVFYGYAHNDLTLDQNGSLLGGTLLSSLNVGVTSHELRLASRGAHALQWTVGGYIRTAERNDAFNFALFGVNNTTQTRSTAHAIFGEATYTLPSIPVDLTAGLRWFEDDLRGQEANSGVVTPQPGDRYHSWNPRFSVAWHPSGNSTLYASAAKGFRSGQLQPTVSTALAATVPGLVLPAALRQDLIWTYEVGAKAELFDRLLTVEAAVFYSDWKDVAVRISIGATGFNGLINSPGTRTLGVELSLVARPVTGLTVSAGSAYIDAAYAAAVPGTGITDGAPIEDVPRFTANVSADYSWPIGTDVSGFAHLSGQHSSPRRFDAFPIYRPGDTIDRVDARIGIDLAQISIAVFADNLADDNGATSFRTVQPIAPGDNDIIAYRLRPRTIGAELSFRFGGATRR